MEVHAGGTPLHQGIMYEPRPKCYYTRQRHFLPLIRSHFITRRPGGTIPSDMGTALRNFPGIYKLSWIRFRLVMALIATIKSATYGEQASFICIYAPL